MKMWCANLDAAFSLRMAAWIEKSSAPSCLQTRHDWRAWTLSFTHACLKRRIANLKPSSVAHELTRKRCDFLVSLPTTGPVKSLNVSVATGVVLFEALRQRHSKRNQ